MTNNYSSNLDFIAHSGKGHDDNPPGRGSGRYPWGSGAKWSKTSRNQPSDRIKRFFGDKNRVEKSDAQREMNASNEVKFQQRNNSVNIKDYKLPESHEADRKAAIESGDRNQILKYFSESSNDELQRAISKAGMMDSLDKSISDSKSKTLLAEDLAKTQKEKYIKSALGSGDIKQIFSVASDPSVTNKDLVDALNKVNTMKKLDKQVNQSKVHKVIDVTDKYKSVLDKSLDYYKTTSNIWNLIATYYNNSQAVKNDPTKALSYMLHIPM